MGNIGSGFACLARRHAFLPGCYKLDIWISFSMLTIREPFKGHLIVRDLVRPVTFANRKNPSTARLRRATERQLFAAGRQS